MRLLWLRRRTLVGTPELPAAIRDRFETRFTARRMAEDYLSLYHRMAVKSRPALRVVT